MSQGRKWLFVVLAIALLLPACAKDPADRDETETAADQAKPPPEARALLMEMATFLAGLDAFSAKIQGGYDVVQVSGQKIEFLETREVTLKRPDHLRVEEKSADGRGQSVTFDGSKITIWDGEVGVFAQADQPGSVDDAIVYFVRDLQMRLPLAPLLTTRFPAELERRLQSVDYVERTDVLGEPAHHIAGRTKAMDFQVWIADDERPFPLRIVLTYPDVGRPQYWAQFSDWNLKPRVSDKNFAFEVPQGARQIAFQVQIPTMAGAAPSGNATVEEDEP